MNILFDTSALIAVFVKKHPNHKDALNYFLDNFSFSSENEFFISTHTVAEFFRHITSGRQYMMYRPEQALQVITEEIRKRFTPVSLEHEDYLLVVEAMSKLSLSGAVIYDGLIARAAEKAGCSELVTYNIKDFQRVWPLTSANLIEP